jgi:hypothetical protein
VSFRSFDAGTKVAQSEENEENQAKREKRMKSTRRDTPGQESPAPGVAGASRRDFLRKSAIAGGAIWIAPAITKASSAHAQAGSGVTSPCGDECEGTAYGIFLDLLSPSTFPSTPTSPCPAVCSPVDIPIPGGPPGPFLIHAGSACGCTRGFSTPGDACFSEGEVVNAQVLVNRSVFGTMATQDLLIGASVLRSTTSQDCIVCGPAMRSSHVAGLTIGLPEGTNQSILVATPPNTVIVNSLTTFPGFRIVVNEQGCTDTGNWYTAALTVRLPSAAPLPGRTIILGYSEARKRSCPEPCSSPPDSAPLVPIP